MPVMIPDYLADRPVLPRAPVDILREAADKFKDRTNGLVEATVFTLNPGGSTLFRHSFYLIVPTLNDYTDALFYVWHSASLYPVTVLDANGKQGKDEKHLKAPEQFEQELARIFDSPETRQRIYALMESAAKTGRDGLNG